MREDIVKFMDSGSRLARDWRADLALWAQLAHESATILEACRPGENEDLVEASLELLTAVQAASPGDQIPRAGIAALCGYVNATARVLAHQHIPGHESDAVDAARDVAYSSVQMLIAMDGDYGDPCAETFE